MELTTFYQLISSFNLTYGAIRTYARYTSQSAESNTTTYQLKQVYYCSRSGGYVGVDYGYGELDGSGREYTSYTRFYYGETTIQEVTRVITHNTDGSTPTKNVSTSWNASFGGSGSTNVNITFPTINRLSTFSLSKSSFNIEETIQAYITQYVSGYHQDLYMDINGTDTLIQSSATGTIDIETNLLANAIYQVIPNTKYLNGTFKLLTYNSSNTLIGTVTQSYTANVVNSEPLFDIAYQDTNATTLAITSNNQQIIQNNSTLQLNFTNATAQHYSTLSTYSININGDVITGSISSSTLDVDWGTLNVGSNINATISVTDSRGFTTTKTLALTILPYQLPSATITLNRQQNYYTQTDITVDGTYSSLDSKNTLTIQYRIKKSSESSYGAYSTLTNNVTSTFSADNAYEWNVQVLLTDLIGSTPPYDLTLRVGTPILFIDRKKYSVGINCLPQNSNTLEINGKTLLDLTYPVGSIYISANSTDPSTLFGGTWESFGTGRTLVGIDTNDSDFDTVLETGGSKTHTHGSNTTQNGTLSAVIGATSSNPSRIGYSASNLLDVSQANATYSVVGSSLEQGATFNHYTEVRGTTGSGNSLQPYIVVYMWKRVS